MFQTEATSLDHVALNMTPDLKIAWQVRACDILSPLRNNIAMGSVANLWRETYKAMAMARKTDHDDQR